MHRRLGGVVGRSIYVIEKLSENAFYSLKPVNDDLGLEANGDGVGGGDGGEGGAAGGGVQGGGLGGALGTGASPRSRGGWTHPEGGPGGREGGGGVPAPAGPTTLARGPDHSILLGTGGVDDIELRRGSKWKIKMHPY